MDAVVKKFTGHTGNRTPVVQPGVIEIMIQTLGLQTHFISMQTFSMFRHIYSICRRVYKQNKLYRISVRSLSVNERR
jgi:hypothetical protein